MDENRNKPSRYSRNQELYREINRQTIEQSTQQAQTPEPFSNAVTPDNVIATQNVHPSYSNEAIKVPVIETASQPNPIVFQNDEALPPVSDVNSNVSNVFMLDENDEEFPLGQQLINTPYDNSDSATINEATPISHVDNQQNVPIENNFVNAEVPPTESEINSIVQEVLMGMETPIEFTGEPIVLPDETAVIDTQDVEEKPAKKFRFGRKKKKKQPENLNTDGEVTAEDQAKPKSSKWYKIGIGFFTFCNICALICFFVAYGPFNYVRDMFVTTAMRTMTHKYLANVLYSTDTIQEILANNVTLEPDEVMDASEIQIGNIQESDVYANLYEEQVLKRDEGNDLYKIVRIDENGYKGWITFIYDPTKVQLAVTKDLGKVGERVTAMAKRTKAVVAINGAGFMDYAINPGGHPTGYVIKEGKIVWSRKRGGSWGGGTIGFNEDGVMLLLKERGKAAVNKGVYNGVDFGPFLIVNGKSGEVKGNGGWGIHPRTVIGQRKDGIVIFLTIDGRSTSSAGIGLSDVIKIMQRYDAYNVANLDGGSSTVLVVDGKVKNNPTAYTDTGERGVATAWIVVE